MIEIHEAPVTPVEPTTPIKPSEALRLGCLIAPRQAFMTWDVENGAACALSTMRLGFGSDEAYEQFKHDPTRVDNGYGDAVSLASFVLDVNDNRRWTREQIADWLEGLGL